MTSQVIVLGEPLGDRKVGQYYTGIDEMMAVAKGALARLSEEYDVIVIEGAGGAAEINLYDRDIANSRIARAVNSPILLVGDIERGGVFASLYGTMALLPEADRKLVKGMIINKFRGDVSLLAPGIEELEKLTGVRVLGTIPYEHLQIPSEDSVSIEDKKASGIPGIDIAVIRFPLISNFTDFEPLERIAMVRYVSLDGELGQPDLIILPGTKNTVSDLKALNASPLCSKIKELAGIGTPVIGICGGYQMLGDRVVDYCIEGDAQETIPGLGLLPATTMFDRYEKITRQSVKKVTAGGPILGGITGMSLHGYEIHMGKSESSSPVFEDDGCINDTGTIIGTYLHGLFENEVFTSSLLRYACERKGVEYRSAISSGAGYGRLADLIESSLDISHIITLLESQ